MTSVDDYSYNSYTHIPRHIDTINSSLRTVQFLLQRTFRWEISPTILEHIQKCYGWQPEALLKLDPCSTTIDTSFCDTFEVMQALSREHIMMMMTRRETQVIIDPKEINDFTQDMHRFHLYLQISDQLSYDNLYHDSSKDIFISICIFGTIAYLRKQKIFVLVCEKKTNIFDALDFMTNHTNISIVTTRQIDANSGNITVEVGKYCIAQYFSSRPERKQIATTAWKKDNPSKLELLVYRNGEEENVHTCMLYKCRHTKFVQQQFVSSTKFVQLLVKNQGFLLTYCTDKNTKMISQAMLSGPGDVRFRGVMAKEVVNGEVKYTRILHGDEIVYEEDDNGKVKLDKLNNRSTRPEMLIGWKVAKMCSCNNDDEEEKYEYRILKLGIPVDAEWITPVTDDCLINAEKLRASKCIVLDIQLPLKDQEQSVVPQELTAKSYIYDGGQVTIYRVGQEVYPHEFDGDSQKSCAPGIHFYKYRKSVFDTYLNNL